jgi:hypothetical protein
MRLRWVVVVVALVLAGCSSAGGFLSDDDADTGVGFPHARIGEQLWFALPSIDNDSGQVVRLVDIKIADIPPQVKVLRYRGQSTISVGWRQLTYREGGGARENPLNQREVKIRDIIAPPHGRADGYVMAEVELTAPKRAELRHAVVTYEVEGRQYRQQLSMDVVIEVP